MRTLRIGCGTTKVDPTTRRFMLDIGIDSDKPANERVRNIVVPMIFLALFMLSIWGMKKTDAPVYESQTVTLIGGGR